MTVLLLAPASSPLASWLREREEKVVHIGDQLDTEGVERHEPDVLVSYGYRHILRADVLDRVPVAVNLHISLLPWNRGADPNLWSWLEDTPKGVTVHHIDLGIDTGDIVAQREIALDDRGTLATTYAQLQEAMQALFRELWPEIRLGRAEHTPQPPGGSMRRAADGESVAHLLTQGWDTPVADLIGRAPLPTVTHR